DRYQRMNATNAASGASSVQARREVARIGAIELITPATSEGGGGGAARAFKRKGSDTACWYWRRQSSHVARWARIAAVAPGSVTSRSPSTYDSRRTRTRAHARGAGETLRVTAVALG